MPDTKRRHAKSRRGCSQCKKRHVKCDEIIPSCSNCSRRGARCDFEEWKPAMDNLELWTLGSKGSRPGSDAQSTGKESTERHIPASFSAEDMFLMQHFTAHTVFDLGPVNRRSYHEVWQKVVPELAEQCLFLLHAILAAAACHKATTVDLNAQYISTARRHHAEAMKLFREHSIALGTQQACALLPFSILILLVSLYLDQPHVSPPENQAEALVNNIALCRSSVALLSAMIHDISQSRVSVLLEHTREVRHYEMRNDALDALNLVDASLKHVALDELLDYQMASTQLRDLYHRVGAAPRDWAHLLSWAFRLRPHFFELLKARRPPALVIVAHWCVLLHHAPTRWFFGSRARLIVLDIEAELRSTLWSSAMVWPLQQISKHH